MKQMFPKGRTPRVQTMRGKIHFFFFSLWKLKKKSNMLTKNYKEKPDDQTEGDNDKPRRGRGRPKG